MVQNESRNKASNGSSFSDVYELNKVAFEQDAEAKLVEQLRKRNAFIPSLSLVAIINNKIVGQQKYLVVLFLTARL